jgi:hypothetical protein
MRITVLMYLISLFFSSSVIQSMDTPEIVSPESGQVLQGAVSISGSTLVSGFQFSEIAFSYDADVSGTWFLITKGNEPVERGELTVWDTTTISDGSYRLRLRVYLENGEMVETGISGLRIRNYSPVETATPESVILAIVETATEPTPTLTPTHAPAAAPVQLPPNPALVTHNNLRASIYQGVLVALSIFGIIGFYLMLKKLFQRS